MSGNFDHEAFSRNLAWKNDIKSAIGTSQPECKEFYIKNIFSAHGPWSQEDVKAFAYAIIECATDVRDLPFNAGDHFAVVTNMVCNISVHYLSDSSEFMTCFKEVLNVTFFRYWGSQFTCHPESIGRGSSLVSVNEALALCTFIGSLCVKRIVPYNDIITFYIPAIVSNVTTLEHIVAVENILNNAGSSLWKYCVDPQDAAQRFLDESFVITDQVIESCESSILGYVPRGIATVSEYIHHVANKARYYALHADSENITVVTRRVPPYQRKQEA